MIETSLLLGKGYRMNPLKEIVSGTPTKFLGANITGGEGGVHTKILLMDLDDSRHFRLCEVDEDGTVVKTQSSFHLINVYNLGKNGVQLLKETIDDPIIQPGQHKDVDVGLHTLTVEGTADQEILFNGQTGIKYDDRKTLKAALSPLKH